MATAQTTRNHTTKTEKIFTVLQKFTSERAKNGFLIFTLLIIAAPLRFTNLGYSEFQDDEKKAMIRLATNQAPMDFLISQRKGPMQFLVSEIPLSITHDRKNEVAQRLPFTIFNLGSIVVLYLLILKLTNSKLGAFLGTLLYSVNGFIVGFSRIAQYQNLNLFFSFLSLYFYANLQSDTKKLTRSALLGTLFFCLSFLSHWDAIYYLIPTSYFYITFLKRPNINFRTKRKVTLYNLFVGSVMLIPFLIPYLCFHAGYADSANYFQRRIGLSDYGIAGHKYIFELYNPYITLPLLGFLLLCTTPFIKKNHMYFLWLLTNFLFVYFFMPKPGTHIYNYIIPTFLLIAITLGIISQNVRLAVKKFIILGFIFAAAFLFYQSYMLFVDHTTEYPWESKKLFRYETTPYINKEVLTFGFPHFRDLKYISEVMQKVDPSCNYISNEGKEITQIYIDNKFGESHDCLFVLSIKLPFISTRDNITFAQTGGRSPIYSYSQNESSLSKLYFIDRR